MIAMQTKRLNPAFNSDLRVAGGQKLGSATVLPVKTESGHLLMSSLNISHTLGPVSMIGSLRIS